MSGCNCWIGWRRGEVTGLQWRQVDFAAGEIRLDPGTTKSDEGRVFPFTVDLRVLLVAQHAEHGKLKKAGTIEPWVFWAFARVALKAARPQP